MKLFLPAPDDTVRGVSWIDRAEAFLRSDESGLNHKWEYSADNLVFEDHDWVRLNIYMPKRWRGYLGDVVSPTLILLKRVHVLTGKTRVHEMRLTYWTPPEKKNPALPAYMFLRITDYH